MIQSPTRVLVLVAAMAAAVIGFGCGASRDEASTGPSPAIKGLVPRATGEVPFERAWEIHLPGTVERSWIGPQIPNLVFFQIAGTHEIHCVDASSGQTRWIGKTLSKPVLGEPFVQRVVQPGEHENETRIEERLFAVVDDTLFCWDIPTGQLVWRYVLPFAPSTGPMAVGSESNLHIYIGDWNDRIQVVTLHVDTLHPEKPAFPYVLWQWNLDAPVLSTAAEIENRVYVSDTKGSVRCFSLDRVQVWSTPTGGSIEGGVTVRDRALYAGTDGNAVHAISNLTGERLGQFNLQGPVRHRPFWFNGEPERLYVWTTSPDPRFGGLNALRVQPANIPFTDVRQDKDGKDAAKQSIEVVRMGQDWFVPGARHLLASTPLHLLVSGAERGLIWAVHRGTGKVEWTWDLAKGWPGSVDGKPSRIDHVVSYQDRGDALRTLIAVDEAGYCAGFRVFDFVPTPEQQAKGITSRALAGQPTEAVKPAKDKEIKKKPAKDAKPDAKDQPANP